MYRTLLDRPPLHSCRSSRARRVRSASRTAMFMNRIRSPATTMLTPRKLGSTRLPRDVAKSYQMRTGASGDHQQRDPLSAAGDLARRHRGPPRAPDRRSRGAATPPARVRRRPRTAMKAPRRRASRRIAARQRANRRPDRLQRPAMEKAFRLRRSCRHYRRRCRRRRTEWDERCRPSSTAGARDRRDEGPRPRYSGLSGRAAISTTAPAARPSRSAALAECAASSR